MRTRNALLLLLLVLTPFLYLNAQSRQGERRVTARVKNIRLRDLFSIIEGQTHLSPLFNNDQLNGEEKVDVDFDNEPLDNVLAFLLRSRGLTWQYDEDTYIVQFKKSGAPDLGELPAEKIQNVSGLVTGVDGLPLERVSVIEKISGKVAHTDKDGVFQLAGIRRNAILTFSYVGYLPTDRQVKNDNMLKVELQAGTTDLDEVVVIAYGTSTRRNLTGAISKVTAADIAKQPISNPVLALQGRVPGLFISQLSGLPGAEVKLELRGRNSIAAGNDPLYIVDGVPFPTTALTLNNILPNNEGISPLGASNPLNMLNPADIESIEVLKDADATAIYGSRGANGIILITTQKGEPGKMELDATVYAGTGKSAHLMQFLNTSQYLQMRREAIGNDNSEPQPSDNDLSWDSSRNSNWERLMLGGISRISDAQLAAKGGNNNFRYRISSGYRRETTIYPGSFSYNKASVHGNFILTTANQRGKATITAGYTAERNYLPSVDLAAFTRIPPNTPRNETDEGGLNWEGGTYDNPMGALQRAYKGNTGYLMGNLVFSYDLLTGLQLKTSFGYNSIMADEKQPTPFHSLNPAYGYGTTAGGFTKFGNSSFRNWIIEPQANYQLKWGNSQLSLMAGITFQQDVRDQKGFYATGFTSDAPQQLENILAASKIDFLGVGYYFYRYNAFFGRINYNYKGKYILHLTGRRDASSRFASSRQFANFGSLGTAWIFSEEQWAKAAFPFLSFGKLRASYGITGNDQIKDYAFNPSYSPGRLYDDERGQLPARLSNGEYRWELCKKLETGVELGFMQDKLILRAGYYRNLSTNQLVDEPLPLLSGFSSVQNNFPAKVENSGAEMELNTINIRKDHFTWTTSLNLSIPYNKLVSFPDLEKSTYKNKFSEGAPLDINKGYRYLGVDPLNGVYMFAGIDKEGKISPGAASFTKKIGVILYGGLQSSLQYKGWYLDILVQFVKQDRYNYLFADQAPGIILVNQPLEVLDRWRAAGDISNVQRFTQSGLAYQLYQYAQQSDAAILDASFIRLKNINLGYNLPEKCTKKAHLQHARFFLQGQNLVTLTHYKGRDPEVATNRDVYPPLRVLTLGLQIGL